MTSAPAKSEDLQLSLAQDGDGLGAMWGQEKARAMLTDAGFTDVQVRSLPHDILNSYYIVRKVGADATASVACLK